MPPFLGLTRAYDSLGMRAPRAAVLLLAASLVAASCTNGADNNGDERVDTKAATEATIDEEIEPGEPAIDPSLTRDDVDCSPAGVGAEFAAFTTVHVVVDGILGEPCLGDEDPTLLDAWNTLAVIAPTLARADLGLFGGFTGEDDGDEATLAFVNAMDDDGTLFQMSVNLDAFEDDVNESYLTMAHEFSHVFTQLPSELDRSVEAEASCATYDNGEGCFLPDSLMALYIDEFWPGDLLDDVDPSEDATVASGAERCELNADFLGPYAASNPEEDFGETFSAFVFRLDTDSAIDAKTDWMAEQPGLVEFRNRATEAGLTPLENNFERCG